MGFSLNAGNYPKVWQWFINEDAHIPIWLLLSRGSWDSYIVAKMTQLFMAPNSAFKGLSYTL